MSSLSIGRRLGAAFAVRCVFLMVVSAAGLNGPARQRAVAEQAAQLHGLRDKAVQTRYAVDDVAGWQGYIFAQALVDGVAQATSADSYSRMGIATSRAAGDKLLKTVDVGKLTPKEQTIFTKVTDPWDAYFVLNDAMIALLGQDTATSTATAYASLNGELDAAWRGLLDSTFELEKQLDGRIADLDGAASAARARALVLAAGHLAVLLAIILGTATTRSIVHPLRRCVVALRSTADGDLTVTADVSSRDEVGQLAQALTTAQDSMLGTLTGVEETAAALAAAAEEMSRDVQTVASGAEEMDAAIREIAQNANEAARVANRATEVATTTTDTITRLGASSAEIGNVVTAITPIAEPTNLLALNATIEAARAGEAGRGFAVVAGEVKELARETARATEEITRRVEAIQAETTGAVCAIGEISAIIASINDYQLTIASAVEEQAATTNEMSRSVIEAATGSGKIAANLAGVASGVASASQPLAQMGGSVSDVARMPTDLHERLASFTYELPVLSPSLTQQVSGPIPVSRPDDLLGDATKRQRARARSPRVDPTRTADCPPRASSGIITASKVHRAHHWRRAVFGAGAARGPSPGDSGKGCPTTSRLNF